MPLWLDGLLFDGVYLAAAWVISVMLPPMAIFFPLFTLLEDFGYLPRVAFNLDTLFRKAGRFTRAKPAPGEKQELRREARRLKSDARLLEKQAVQYVFDDADVVCSTTTFEPDTLGDRRFDLAVID